MKGLLVKDASTMIKETRFFFLLAAVMAVLQNDFLFTYIVVYAATLPMTAIAYDERSKWNQMEETLPLTKGQLVGSKYVIGYISVMAAILLILCGRLLGVVMKSSQTPLKADVLFSLLIISCIAMTIQAVNLPLMFWIGVERGRLLFVLIIVSATVAAASIWEDVVQNAILLDRVQFFLIVLAITIAVNLISFQVSKKIYNREK